MKSEVSVMKRLLSAALVAVLLIVLSVPSASAAEPQGQAPQPKAAPQKAAGVTHCELAQLLVQVLGLARFLPASPSCQQNVAMMMNNSISPKEGWRGDAVVTKADLARVIVQALKMQSEVQNPDDPKAWIEYLKSIGVPLDAVGETVSFVDPLAEPVAPNVMSPRVDPLQKKHTFNPVDDTQYGVDMQYVVRILTEFERVAPEFRPPPVTPD
jgi:hypothetical protein